MNGLPSSFFFYPSSFFCCKTMSDHELVSTVSAAAPRKKTARLRLLVLLGLPLIVAALLYNRYDASRPLPERKQSTGDRAEGTGNSGAGPPTTGSPVRAAEIAPRSPDVSVTIAELRSKLQQNPKDVVSRVRLATLLDIQGDGSAAEDTIREALQQGQKHPDLYHTIGMVYLHNEQYRPAIQAFNHEIALRPKNATAYVKLGSACSYAGKADEAEKAFKKALKLDPSLPDIYLGLAFLNNTSDRYPYAVRYLQEYIKRSPQPGPGYALLCRVYLNMNAYDKAVEAGKKAITLMPENPNLWYNLGQAYYHRPDATQLEMAASAFIEAIKRNPDFGHAHFELGSVLTKLGKKAEAVQEFREAVRCEPYQGKYHYQLSRLLVQTGAVEESKQFNKTAERLIPLNQKETKLLDKITVSPQDPALRFELAEVYRQLGRRELAETWYKATLDVAPGHAEARRQLQALNQPGSDLLRLP